MTLGKRDPSFKLLRNPVDGEVSFVRVVSDRVGGRVDHLGSDRRGRRLKVSKHPPRDSDPRLSMGRATLVNGGGSHYLAMGWS
jgi:hypothetical protein